MHHQYLLLLPVALLSACAMNDDLGPVVGVGPQVALVNSAGGQVGAVQSELRPEGTYLRIAVEGLPPGEHGLHLHAVGRCDIPAFQTAGAHWNPMGRQHGPLNRNGAHAGDLPNLTVSANGRGAINFLVSGHDMHDPDGTSLVIHAKPDDLQTDPSGNSGDRIACAVITSAQP